MDPTPPPGATTVARVRGLLAAALCLGVCASSAQRAPPPEPCAIVTATVQGAQLWRRGAGGSLAVLDLLQVADEIRLAEAVRVEAAFLAGVGRVYDLRGPGRFRIERDAIVRVGEGAAPVARDLAPQWRAVHIDPARLGRASVSLRGVQSEPFELLQPRGQERAQRVSLLRWRRPAGAEQARWRYAVRLTDAGGTEVYSATVAQEFLALPAELALAPGATYQWTVEAVCDDGRRLQALAQFTPADAAREERLAGLRIALQRDLGTDPAPGARTAEEIVYALALAQEGLREESDAVLHRLDLPDWPLYRDVRAP